MRYYSKLTLILTIVALGISCKKGETPTSAETSQNNRSDTIFYSLNVDNYWMYRDTSYSAYSPYPRYTFRVLGKPTILYKGRSIQVSSIGSIDSFSTVSSDTNYFRWEGGNLYQYNPDPLPLRALYLKGSNSIGDQFVREIIAKATSSSPPGGPPPTDTSYIVSRTWRCIAVDQVISLPAGTFKSVVFRETTSDSTKFDYYFFADSVGMVYSKSDFENYPAYYKSRGLISFLVK